ncbi:MAG TPA: uroporphyrinogen-III synthase [Caulobacteraceae bacterium]|jgi:uroporphyrinogen-III synthase|nr:uroporphyrinogen-III synthase [Caulobacteraceae bacterium]
MRVWVSRTQPGADATAQRLRELGHEPIVSPVLEVRALEPFFELDPSDVEAIAFTSQNAIEPITRHYPEFLGLPVFAVGEATATAARAAGYDDVCSADGDVDALATLIAQARPRIVLHPTASEPASEIVRLLNGPKIEARSVAVYETLALEPQAALAQLTAIDAVLIHSPNGARRVAASVTPAQVQGLVFACISPAAARPLTDHGHEKVRSAPFPNEASLLKLLDE